MIPDLRDPTFIGALVHFDQAATQLSFTRAAAALGVTPSAVSHRIGALEAALDKPLFERRTRQVSLTPEGVELARVTHRAMEDLTSVTRLLAERKVLRLSVPTYLSTTWLMPRLAQFEQSIPDLRVDLLHRTGTPDLRDVDAAIVWSQQPPAGLPGTPLFATDCVPVAAPGGVTQDMPWDSKMAPIHYRDRDSWRQWLRAAGGPAAYAERGDVLHDPLLVLEAAVHERGIAMGFLPFVAQQIDAGRLVRAHAVTIRSEQSYWLVVTDDENVHARAFREWAVAAASPPGDPASPEPVA